MWADGNVYLCFQAEVVWSDRGVDKRGIAVAEHLKMTAGHSDGSRDLRYPSFDVGPRQPSEITARPVEILFGCQTSVLILSMLIVIFSLLTPDIYQVGILRTFSLAYIIRNLVPRL
jgi:hypothetical protein